ncbi:MAG: 50S ribosomal protein L11 methyltransferase [Candidatus Methylomirabilales bacterium]
MGEGYVEVSVSASAEAAEALTDFLFSEGALGLVTEDAPGGSSEILIRTSFPRTSPVEPIVTRLKQYQQSLAALGLVGAGGRIEVREIPAEDWGRSWKEHFKPLAVGNRLLIAPPWEGGPFPGDRLPIRIDPGMSFGTGHHATTRMCLESLEIFMGSWVQTRGPWVLDVGTGTGILAIAAALLGAEQVVAIDTDPEACEAATKNLALNKTTGPVQILHGGVDALEPERRFDLLLVNLDTKSLSHLFDSLSAHLAPWGRLVASGILVDEERTVSDAAETSAFRVTARQFDGEWLCLTLSPKEQFIGQVPGPRAKRGRKKKNAA